MFFRLLFFLIYLSTSQSAMAGTRLVFKGQLVSPKNQELLQEKVDLISRDIIYPLKVSSTLMIEPGLMTSEYSASYQTINGIFNEGISITRPYLEASPEKLLTIFSHEFGHAIFESSVLIPAMEELGINPFVLMSSLVIHLRRFSSPLNEMFADMVAHLYNEAKVSESLRVSIPFIEKSSLSDELKKELIGKFDNGMMSCRDYEGNYALVHPETAEMQNLALDDHLILCPTGKVIWEDLRLKQLTPGQSMLRVTTILKSYLVDVVKSHIDISHQRKDKYEWNEELIHYYKNFN